MFCEKCQIDPTFHSFIPIGNYNGVRYFYTAPSRSKDYTTDGSKLENFKKHVLETQDQPWEWIIDCGDLGSNEPVDIKYITGVIKYLSEFHEKTLRRVYVIKLNKVIKAAVFVLKKLFKQNLFDRVEYLDGSPLDLYLQYEKKEFNAKMIKWLNSVDYGKVLPGAF